MNTPTYVVVEERFSTDFLEPLLVVYGQPAIIAGDSVLVSERLLAVGQQGEQKQLLLGNSWGHGFFVHNTDQLEEVGCIGGSESVHGFVMLFKDVEDFVALFVDLHDAGEVAESVAVVRRAPHSRD